MGGPHWKVFWSTMATAFYILASCHILGGELATVQSYLGTKPSASQPQPIISTETQAHTITADEVSLISYGIYKILKSTPGIQTSKTTTTTMYTIPTTIQEFEVDASPVPTWEISSETVSAEPLLNETSSTIETPIVTSYPVITSSPIVPLMTSSKPTVLHYVDSEHAKQGETPQTFATSSSPKEITRASKGLEIEAYPGVSDQKSSSSVASSMSKQIWFIQAKKEMVTSPILDIMASPGLKDQEISSMPPSSQTWEMEMTSSRSLESELSSIVKEQVPSHQKSSPVETSRHESSPSPSSIDETKRSSNTLEIEATHPVLEQRKSSSSPVKILLSSQAKEEMTSLEVLAFKETSSILKEQEALTTRITMSSSTTKQTLHSLPTAEMTLPLALEVMTSLPDVTTFQNVSKTKSPSNTQDLMYSQAKEEIVSFQAVEAVKSSRVQEAISAKTMQAVTSVKVEPSLGLKEMTSSQSSRQIISSSKQETEVQLIQIQTKEVMTSSRLVERSKPSSHTTFLQPSEDKTSTQQIDIMTSSWSPASPQPSKTMTSSKLLTSSKTPTPVQSLIVFEHSIQQLGDMMTSLQPKITIISSPISSSPQMEALPLSQVDSKLLLSLPEPRSAANAMTSSMIAIVMTSSKLIDELTASPVLKSSPVQTAYLHLKEVKTEKSTLILPSSPLADLITSSLPMTVKALTSPTAESAEGATTNSQSSNEKITTSSETNVPATKTVAKTTSHPVTQTTDIDNKPATEHPLTRHRKPTHHSEPTHHGESNNTHSNESDHVVHTGPNGTMKHPHEPPVVDASTQEKVDGGWQISIVVVFGLVGGIVLFVIVMVIKNNREMRLVG